MKPHDIGRECLAPLLAASLGLLLHSRVEAQEGAVAFAEPAAPSLIGMPDAPAPIVTPSSPAGPVLMEGPTIEEMENLRRLEAEETARRIRFFTAIADNDTRTLSAMLNEGIDPNTTLPSPSPVEFQRRFSDERLRYYVTKEQGFTGLMLAASLGNHTIVKFLMMAGADPMRMTKRHRTYALWLAGKYKHVEIMRTLMSIPEDHESRRLKISVDLSTQRAYLWRDGKIEMSTDISSGRTSHPTPTGEYLVTDKYKMWKSTLYHAKMPLFMRLSCGDFGLHVGALPGYPASHGCIRLPQDSAQRLFASVPVGTLVEIR